ncbi:MAG: hypothetical protein V2I97_14935 [Desulfococcaceae bacterium]|jgi:hypothetical protein|nr:hypothetical protein [Desulfococcaceae bacterium]
MRKKAERKIRRAVEDLGNCERHRLDHVRSLAGLHPKIFDKTILDMERVGTIRLFSQGLDEMSKEEISLLVRRGETVYVSFTFIDGSFAGQNLPGKHPGEKRNDKTPPEMIPESAPDPAPEMLPDFLPLLPEEPYIFPDPDTEKKNEGDRGEADTCRGSALDEPEETAEENDPVILILQGLLPGEWEMFESLCENREGKDSLQVMEEMIRKYIRESV